MNKERYIHFRQKLLPVAPSNWQALVHVLFFFTLLGSGIALAIQESISLYMIGELLIVLALINSQTLVHELGHGNFFKTRKVNHFFGHIIALFPILPYTPWVLIHAQHHKWGGNKEQDPTVIDKKYEDLKESQKSFMNFCWKYWVPVFALSYSVNAFWNYFKLSEMFPRKRFSIIFSMAAQVFFYLALGVTFGIEFLKVWVPSYLIFLALSEPLLLSQHVHVDQADVVDPDFTSDKTYHVRMQDQFSRTLKMPKWFSKWILLGFNEHATHHIFPNLPGYNYHLIDESYPNTMHWSEWYKKSKSIPAATLLFKNNQETKVF
jgi:omega-6 fatty acid desaturase (delta-12 desaturase)